MALSSQITFLHDYLRGTNRTLTATQARKFGVKNLAARISELRDLGLRVRVAENRKGETKYAISARDMNNSRSSLTVAAR